MEWGDKSDIEGKSQRGVGRCGTGEREKLREDTHQEHSEAEGEWDRVDNEGH